MSAMDTNPPPRSESRPVDSGNERLLEIGRLAGHVAHKINNHLTTILTFSHLMREKPNLDAQDREDLELMIREATQAAALARNLQDQGAAHG
jgi:two-component system, NtrC family, sensor kinase